MSVVRIAGDVEGPRAVFFSGIHGNEVSGVHAIEKLLFDFFGGARVLKRGTLTLVRANEQALAAEQRYLKLNMNRLFRDGYGEGVDRTCYEFLRSQQLKPLLRDLRLFPRFSFGPVGPGAIPGRRAQGGRLLSSAGHRADHHGLEQILCRLDRRRRREFRRLTWCSWRRRSKSGSHFDKSAIDVSYSTAIAMLQLLDMIERPQPKPVIRPTIVDMYAVVTKDFADFSYARPTVTNFQPIKNGEAFACQNGRPLTVTEDSHLLIPMKPEDTRIGEEVCYLGRRIA